MKAVVVLATLVLLGVFTSTVTAAPSVSYKRVQDPTLGDLGVNIVVRGVWCHDQFGDSPTPLPGEVSFRLRTQEHLYVMGLDPCADWYETARGRGWRSRSWMESWPELRVRVASGRTQTYRFHYAVTVDSRLVEAGALRLRTVRHPEHVIWEDTDDFVNICINHGHTLYSEGGRLYCYFPAWTSVGLRVTPRRQPPWPGPESP